MSNEIIDGFFQAIYLIFTFDPEVWSVIAVSFRVSLTSTFLATLVALPIGSFIGLREFRGKRFISNLINTFMGFPPVVMGLIVFLLLSSSGLFGFLGLLYSTTAMIIAQFLLAVPIILGTGKAAIESVEPALKETVLSLGANERQLWWELIKDSKKSIIAGFLVTFGQAISEVGAVMIVGGNIRWSTRTFTTSIVLQTRMGEFGMAIALGIILITIAFILNYGMTRLQGSGK
ncbi:MAG: ABC transporter permease subunit [Candidatus Lokiarchaeota archaeon]|nr:ABC transporter permease subunit [Candidatus Lokiarchaeota archaeon]